MERHIEGRQSLQPLAVDEGPGRAGVDVAVGCIGTPSLISEIPI